MPIVTLRSRTALAAAALCLLSLPYAPDASANGSQSLEQCAASKLRAAAEACEGLVGAYALPDRSWFGHSPREARIERALADLSDAYAAADAIAIETGAVCSDSTGGAGETADAIASAAEALASAIQSGDDEPGWGFFGFFRAWIAKLHQKYQLFATAQLCGNLVDAEARHLLNRDEDRLREGLAEKQDRAFHRFDRFWALLALIFHSDSGPDPNAIADDVDALTGDVVLAVAVSPLISPEWVRVDPEAVVSYEGRDLEPTCWDGEPWSFFVKGGSVNKLVMYYQGGGACWSGITCGGLPSLGIGPTFKQTVGGSPAGFSSGFADLDNPENPFRDWNQVFVPYCTGDVHWGDAVVEYETAESGPLTVRHKGFVNSQVAEKFAREHFVHPEDVFVTGSSAGAYGAIVNSLYLQERAYPSAQFTVVGDAGNGVITPDFLVDDLSNWGIQNNLPPWMPGLNVPFEELEAADLYIEAAKTYPGNRFATYTTAYDGGQGGQTGFLNIMRTGENVIFWIRWWDASCDWNTEMLALNERAADEAPDNFRYYVGTGSAHTAWGRPKVYDDTTGGVPTLRDWLSEMLVGGPGWTNVVAEDFGVLLDGDPRANPAFGNVEPFDLEAGRIVCD